ncbi:hypothetical protein [Marinoscillum furvescens]|uniref:Tetratricopeptide repeat protein n=1 Tax=Marinoscillum furvescens DSM 4134 TaxID=1122208 RepID=A0A3D9KYB0_MARFU|nr:hypothetical protein [Marinoscillum furvescens]RED92048.1 hypothetical protein C7460_13317 [Marinoscillum furvescens DSM 4134]
MKPTFIIATLICMHYAASGQRDSLRSYYQQSIAAYEAKHYDGFLFFTQKANDLRPNHPAITYNLAAAYALTKQPKAAIATLKHHLTMNASLNYHQDEDFKSLHQRSDFLDLETFVNELNLRISNSKTIHKLDQSQHHIESITSLPSGDLLLGSVNSRRLFIADKKSMSPVFDHAKLYSVMGMDATQNILWVVSAALPEMNRYEEQLKNQSSVFGLNPQNFEVIFQYEVPNALLGDVIAYQEGTALATDGLNNAVYELSSTGATKRFDFSNELYNLQGLAIDGNHLYLADYITGLYHVDLSTEQVRPVKSMGWYADKGIDGLVYHAGKLIAFQNGTTPKRALQITLSQAEVIHAETLDQSLYPLGEPTQGVLVNDQILYISNSAWDAYTDSNYTPDPDRKLHLRAIKLK